MKKLTQAFIFAAGRGERMRPLTDTTPKPLLKVAEKPIIEHIIEKLNKLPDLETIIINGFYLAEDLEEYLRQLNNKKVIFSKETLKLETGGGLLYAASKINLAEPILLINGDIFWQEGKANIPDLELMISSFDEQKCDILLGLKKKDEVAGHDKIVDGKVCGDFNYNAKASKISKPQNTDLSHIFVGLQIIHPRILNNSPTIPFSMNYFYKEFLKENSFLSIAGIELSGKYFHLGTKESLEITNQIIKKLA